ncbi:hypothetical protein J8I87_36045 [Paraburkholderia sp. LEh10]|uniref:hypothetical protein n=1 Tax=Paraburkholderia sp. LEh10 TaxID=2821353 RepID=UPI001AE32F62|nr:hypothetical protein [Paraburkholderia sp. LEh10]MBP0594983.1 hypothetical protein [Paraburkholderia sp. LEh10]
MKNDSFPKTLAAGLLLREVKSGKRFRIITPNGAGFYTMLYNIDDKQNSWPFAKETSEIQRRLSEDEPDETRYVIDLADPWSSCVRTPRPNYNQKKLDKLWKLVEPLVSPPLAYRVMNPTYRNKILMEHAHRTGTSRQSLSRYLRRFWQRGLTREALRDDMDRCGGSGKPKTFQQKKTVDDRQTDILVHRGYPK